MATLVSAPPLGSPLASAFHRSDAESGSDGYGGGGAPPATAATLPVAESAAALPPLRSDSTPIGAMHSDSYGVRGSSPAQMDAPAGGGAAAGAASAIVADRGRVPQPPLPPPPRSNSAFGRLPSPQTASGAMSGAAYPAAAAGQPPQWDARTRASAGDSQSMNTAVISPTRPDGAIYSLGDAASSSYFAGSSSLTNDGRPTARAANRPDLAWPVEPAPTASSSFSSTQDGPLGPRQTPFAHIQGQRTSSSPGDSPTRSMQSVRPSGVDRNSKRDSASGSGSGGSYSSHSQEPQNGQLGRPRLSQAPHATSRTASLYGFPSSASNSAGESVPPPPAPLLNQSHLQVGDMASLLSHDKTLELYRLNARKTNDPDIQYEFCAFVMDVVADLEYSTMLEKTNAGEPLDGSRPPSQQEVERKQKQQALVAESIALLNRLATRGHVNSCYFLADCYAQGIGTPKGKRDYDRAFPLFLTAGKHGHSAGSFRAAQCLENGWGTRKDWTKAISFYRRAAVLSHVGAMHRLGLAELNGEVGLAKRERDGVQWLARAADLADQVDPPQPQSLHELALLHEKGVDNVVFQDEEYAAELLARAAELQYAPSAYKLGECYEYGKMGCPQDAALSIHYYNIAAQQNHPAACFALTAWYLAGFGDILPQSDTEAYLWAKRAAELGLAKAQYACGYFTEVGIGTHPDKREALEWFRQAAAQGDKRAQDRLRMAGQSLPPIAPPQKRHSLPAGVNMEMSAFSMPTKGRRMSTTRILRKVPSSGTLLNGMPLPMPGKKERAFSVDSSRPAVVFGSGSAGLNHGLPPVPPSTVDRKGKGKARSQSGLPELPPVPAHVQAQRDRRYSQPDLTFAPEHNLRTVGSMSDFGPLAYDSGDEARATTLPNRAHPRSASPLGGAGRNASPSRLAGPPRVQMPVPRQQSGLRSETRKDPTSDGQQQQQQERERVLQRRKNSGEDKDCVVM